MSPGRCRNVGQRNLEVQSIIFPRRYPGRYANAASAGHTQNGYSRSLSTNGMVGLLPSKVLLGYTYRGT